LVAVSARWIPTDVNMKGCRGHVPKWTDGQPSSPLSVRRVYLIPTGKKDPTIRFAENRVCYIPYIPPYEEVYISRAELTDYD
jgi:hypothetical protein